MESNNARHRMMFKPMLFSADGNYHITTMTFKTFLNIIICHARHRMMFKPMMFSADGNYHITTMTKATLYHHGLVKWEPPAIFKSSCDIDVRYYFIFTVYIIQNFTFFFSLS